jgi:alpha-D-ribose 1-methylphosphonate 5-triphosphate synthase subunit PhnI
MSTVAGGIVPGFSDPVLHSQQVFRRVLEAMSHPGRPVSLDALPPKAPGLGAEALAVDRVMTEGSLYDRELGGPGDQAGARRPDRGDLPAARLPHHAAALRRVRAGRHRRDGGRTSGASRPPSRTCPAARCSARPSTTRTGCSTSTSPPRGPPARAAARAQEPDEADAARADMLDHEGLIEPERPKPIESTVGDLTREPLRLPAGRDLRLQNLARGDEGFLLALGYSTQRGYGRTIPSPARSAWARSRWRSCPRNSASPIEIGEIT